MPVERETILQADRTRCSSGDGKEVRNATEFLSIPREAVKESPREQTIVLMQRGQQQQATAIYGPRVYCAVKLSFVCELMGRH